MPPPRYRPQPDDSRSEASSTKEKAGTSIPSSFNGKSRRVANSVVTGSSLRDVTTAGPNAAEPGGSASLDAAQGVSHILFVTYPNKLTTLEQIQWSSFDPMVLHGYRYDYRLNTTSAFNHTYNQLVLSQSPMGRMSPTMAQRKEQRRQSKEQLANAVRRHFKSMGIMENEVIVDFLYKIRYQGRSAALEVKYKN